MSGQPVFWENPAFASLMNQMTVAVMKANSAPRALWEKLPEEMAAKPRFYSFYSLDKDNRIAVGEDRECESDAMAIAYGYEILALVDYQKIEVWLRNARVGLVQKNGADGQV
jgi:hypothetical protein